MPYRVSGKCVQVNRNGRWENLKCHESEAKARAHHRALEANVDEVKEQSDKEFMRPSQAEAQYTPLSTKVGQACANCRWLVGDDYCHLISNMPDDILVTGWCNRWEAKPIPPEPEPVPVVIVEPMEGMDGEHKEAETSAPPEAPAEPEAAKEQQTEQPTADVLSRFAAWIKSTLLQVGETKELAYGFKVHPTNNTWLTWWTAATKDREGEYFPRKAIDDYIARVKSGVEPYPDLWMFHLALPIGKAKEIGRHELIGYAAGTFDDSPRAKAFIAWARKQQGDLPTSHGFKYIKSLKRDGAYWHFNTFEISPLHPVYQKAAHPIARFSEVYNMTIKPEQMKALADVFGSDELAQQAAKEALEAMDKKSKELQAQGVDFKDTGEAPVIPVIDSDARKELDALKTAQSTLEKTLTDNLTKVIQAQGETVAKALKEELDKRDATIKELTDQVTALKAEREAEKELHPPASQSVITQILAGKGLAEAEDLRKKNAETPAPSVVDRFVGGQPIAQG